VYEQFDYTKPEEEWYVEVTDVNINAEILEKLNAGEWYDDVVEMYINMTAIPSDVIDGEVKVTAEGLIPYNLLRDIYVLFNLYYVKKDGVYDNQGWWMSDLMIYEPVEGGYIRIFDDDLAKEIEQYILDGDYKEELIEPFIN
jgi:hypothetical protein